ncbi:MAG: hypothetical protein VB078_07735 [Clostridiaceae bacterium]|nr:hypothetical protein [Clostridiaceae bacterium]
MKKPDLKKELKAADMLGKTIINALQDKNQFKRYVITEKRGNETYTEERIFDKYDIKAIGDMVKTVKSLEELKRSVGDMPAAGERQKFADGEEQGGLVILPAAQDEAQ